MAFMPAGSVPYQLARCQVLLPSWESNDSRTLYYASGWNRTVAYPDLGFEDTYFRDDFTQCEHSEGICG